MRRPFMHATFSLALMLLPAVAPPGAAGAETESWLCPVCQKQEIAREAGSAELRCPVCAITLTREELRLPIAYVSVRTRPSAVVWNVVPECGVFRDEGLVAESQHGPIWIPWSAMEYFLPRMRILRLRGGAEFTTPYAQSKAGCPPESQPNFVVTIADSVGDFRGTRSVRTRAVEEKMVALFIVANSPASLEAARERFLEEVASGRHRRLPRTQPKARNLALPKLPPSSAPESLEVILEARISEQGQILKVNRLRGSGNEEIDRAAAMAVYRSGLANGGEMGVGVPSSLVLTYHVVGDTAMVDAVPAEPPMWREWVFPPERAR